MGCGLGAGIELAGLAVDIQIRELSLEHRNLVVNVGARRIGQGPCSGIGRASLA